MVGVWPGKGYISIFPIGLHYSTIGDMIKL